MITTTSSREELPAASFRRTPIADVRTPRHLLTRWRALPSPAPAVRARWAPWTLVGTAVIWNLLTLRAELFGVSYLDDSSVHEQMVRFATRQLQAGHLPLTSWFPYLGLGSPQFLHYQSLPAMLTGSLGLAMGPNSAFRWTMYVLLAAWPVSIYLAARLFGIGRWGAAASAALSPFLMSAVGVGYEQRAYLWVGYGVWTQLWASWTLPLAWGLSWRTIREGRGFFAAVGLISLTIALHFETGYLALLPLLLWPLVSRTALRTRALRAAVLLAGSLLASAWVIVPLVANRNWAATNEILHGTPLVNGYGAGRVLGWLASGQLLDAGRLPIVTLFAAIGLALVVSRWRADENGRALVVVLVGCTLLSFGRTTFGSLVNVMPGSTDVFFRRFMMGIELSALLFAGIGAAWCLSRVLRIVRQTVVRQTVRSHLGGTETVGWVASTALASVLGILLLAPAWSQLLTLDRHNASAISTQRHADSSEGTQVDRLLAIVRRIGGGRVYAGMPSNWGMRFTVGAVPVFKYLESRDIDEVGYTLRTASLMTDPEYYFDERNPSDYSIFGIHYLILPAGRPPPVRAHLITGAGTYRLWRAPTMGYIHAATIGGLIPADRTDVGIRSSRYLRSSLANTGVYAAVSLDRNKHSRPIQLAYRPRRPIGTVFAERDDLERGHASATVVMRRPGALVLSASYDPGWKATIDGHPRPTRIVAPALVATNVPAGVHTVGFRYQGWSGYSEVLLLCVISLAVLIAIDLIRHSRQKSRHIDA